MAASPSCGARTVMATQEPTTVLITNARSVVTNSPGWRNTALASGVRSAIAPPVYGGRDLQQWQVEAIERFGMAHQQKTARVQRPADPAQHALLCLAVEINHYVAAQHDVIGTRKAV